MVYTWDEVGEGLVITKGRLTYRGSQITGQARKRDGALNQSARLCAEVM